MPKCVLGDLRDGSLGLPRNGERVKVFDMNGELILATDDGGRWQIDGNWMDANLPSWPKHGDEGLVTNIPKAEVLRDGKVLVEVEFS